MKCFFNKCILVVINMATKTMDKILVNVSKMENINDLKKYLSTFSYDLLLQLQEIYDDQYYNGGQSSIIDSRYDILAKIIKSNPLYVPKIGTKLRDGDNEVKLPFWLGSQDKIYPEDLNDLDKWLELNDDEYIITTKLDGVSCLLVSVDGEVKLYTRGDGIKGSDISYLRPYFKSIPAVIDEDIAVRGELIMKKKTFEEKYADVKANPRNMVAGRINGKTARDGLHDIDFVAYEIVGDGEMQPQKDQLDKLKDMGFTVVKHKIFDHIDVELLTQLFISVKKNEPYDVDGIIVMANVPYERNKAGNPEYSFAFKVMLEDSVYETTVEEVIWSVSKWGVLKPKIRVIPVSIGGGITLTYATAFNAKYIVVNKIGKGSVIKITRSGDVIPYIVGTVIPADKGDLPEDIDYKWNESGVDIYTLDLPAEACIKLIASFFEKTNIKYVKEATIEKLYNAGINSLMKIIGATQEELKSVPTIGDKSADRIYNNIRDGLKKLQMKQVIGASGIFGMGIGVRKIGNLFTVFPDLLEVYDQLDEEELVRRLLAVDNISVKTAIRIIKNLKMARAFKEEMKQYVSDTKQGKKVKQTLVDMKVVFSGFRDEDMSEKIGKRGGQVMTSVSSKTSAIIIPDNNTKLTAKIIKAKENGTVVYSRSQFITSFL